MLETNGAFRGLNHKGIGRLIMGDFKKCTFDIPSIDLKIKLEV